MAQATSQAECIDRHRKYEIDISRRLSFMQRARIARMLSPIRPGDHVLDVGCNSGYIVEFLPRACVVAGVDVAEGLVTIARTRLARVDVAPAEALPHADRSFDAVVLGEILEHVHDPAVVLREARRVARRVIVGSTPHERGRWGHGGRKPPSSHRFHVRCFTAGELRATLEAAGLLDVAISTIAERSEPVINVFRGRVP